MTILDDIFGPGGPLSGFNLFDVGSIGGLFSGNLGIATGFGGAADAFRLQHAGDENQAQIDSSIGDLRDLQGGFTAGNILDDAGLPFSSTIGGQTFFRPSGISDNFDPNSFTADDATTFNVFGGDQPVGPFSQLSADFGESGLGTNVNFDDRFTSADVFAENNNFSPIDLDQFKFDPDSIDFPDLDSIRRERLGGIAESARIAQEQLRQDVVSTSGGPENAASELTRLGFLGQIGAGRAASGVESDITGLEENRAGLLAGLSANNLGLLGDLAKFNVTTETGIAETLATLTGQDQSAASVAHFQETVLPALQAALTAFGGNLSIEEFIASLQAANPTPVFQLSPTVGDIVGQQNAPSGGDGGGGFLGFG